MCVLAHCVAFFILFEIDDLVVLWVWPGWSVEAIDAKTDEDKLG